MTEIDDTLYLGDISAEEQRYIQAVGYKIKDFYYTTDLKIRPEIVHEVREPKPGLDILTKLCLRDRILKYKEGE